MLPVPPVAWMEENHQALGYFFLGGGPDLWHKHPTVDGWNPANPPEMYETLYLGQATNLDWGRISVITSIQCFLRVERVLRVYPARKWSTSPTWGSSENHHLQKCRLVGDMSLGWRVLGFTPSKFNSKTPLKIYYRPQKERIVFLCHLFSGANC